MTESPEDLCAVTVCCNYAAAMLDMADGENPNFNKHNRGQAELLREAGRIASDLLAALKAAREMLMQYEQAATGETFNDLQINAAIAKAEGRS